MSGGTEPELGVVVPPGQGPTDRSAFLCGPSDGTVVVNPSEATLTYARAGDVSVDAALQRTDRVDEESLAGLAARHDGGLPTYLPGEGGETTVHLEALPDRTAPQVYEADEELGGELFETTAVGDREVSVNPITTATIDDRPVQMALDVRLADGEVESPLDYVVGPVRGRLGRPSFDAGDNPGSVLLVGGPHTERHAADIQLRARLRGSDARVGAVTHPDPESDRAFRLLDRLDHDALVVTGGELDDRQRAAAAERGADVVAPDDGGVVLRLTADGLSVAVGREREEESESVVEVVDRGRVPETGERGRERDGGTERNA